VYFPTNSIVSLLYVMQDGFSAEIGVVATRAWWVCPVHGRRKHPESRVGRARATAIAQSGACCKPNSARRGLQHLLLRYTQALITQMAQTAVCNRHHTVEQQLCRWLLLRPDRLPSNELTMTQELIANMLGVRREGVTERLDICRRGIDHYSRGRSPCWTVSSWKRGLRVLCRGEREYGALLPKSPRTRSQ